MAINYDAVYSSVPDTLVATTTAANVTLTDAPDNVVELALSANYETYGGAVVGLHVVPRGTMSAAAVAYVYVSLDGGTTKKLVMALNLAAQTLSTTVAPTQVAFRYRDNVISRSNPFPIRPGAGATKFRLYAGVSIALTEGFDFLADLERRDAITV